MYLASFNHGGRDLVGVRWGDDKLIPLEAAATRPIRRGKRGPMWRSSCREPHRSPSCRSRSPVVSSRVALPPYRSTACAGTRLCCGRENRGRGDEQLRFGRPQDQCPQTSDVLPEAPQQPAGPSERNRDPLLLRKCPPGARARGRNRHTCARSRSQARTGVRVRLHHHERCDG